jgi:hypothetical protein
MGDEGNDRRWKDLVRKDRPTEMAQVAELNGQAETVVRGSLGLDQIELRTPKRAVSDQALLVRRHIDKGGPSISLEQGTARQDSASGQLIEVECPYPFHLALAAPGQLGSALVRQPRAPQRDDALMGGDICHPPRIFASRLGTLHTLALSLSASVVFIPRHLKGQLEQQLLHRVDHDPGYAVNVGREFGQID